MVDLSDVGPVAVFGSWELLEGVSSGRDFAVGGCESFCRFVGPSSMLGERDRDSFAKGAGGRGGRIMR